MENENLEVQEMAQPEEMQENETLTAESNEEEVVKDIQEDIQTKSFTQNEVNEMIRARLERNNNSFFKRYGVENRDGLDGLIGKAQSYNVMKERYNGLKDENAQLKERIAFLSNQISPDREEDVRAYFKGKEMEFNEEALIKELETHPEWRKVIQEDTTPKTTIKVLGVEHKDRNIQETEAEKQKRIFGI